MSFYEDMEKSLLEAIEMEKENLPIKERKEMPAKTYYIFDDGYMCKNNFRHTLKEELKKPEFKREWDSLHQEDKLIHRMIELRKEQGLSRKKLARLVGEKKKTIENIENRWESPDVWTFNKILNALGYTLQIVSKNDK